jgi:hypothetical protein
MADVDATNYATIEKRACGHPRGSKNQPKSTLSLATSSSTPAKRRPGRPLGSKNKKSSMVTTDPADRLDVSVAHPTLLSSSSGDLFSFFSFAGAQCRQQQCLPLKFTEFMEGRELRELYPEKHPAAGRHMSWRCIMMAMAMLSSEVAGTILLRIMIFIKVGS